MNKAELIEALADKTGLQKQEAKKVLDAYIEIVTERMSENEEIVLVGFGTLIPRPQTQRLARNPKTGTPVQIPARTPIRNDAGSVRYGFTPFVIIVAVSAAPSGKLPSTVRSGKSRILYVMYTPRASIP